MGRLPSCMMLSFLGYPFHALLASADEVVRHGHGTGRSFVGVGDPQKALFRGELETVLVDPGRPRRADVQHGPATVQDDLVACPQSDRQIEGGVSGYMALKQLTLYWGKSKQRCF